ncbi:uncharacterized protein LOC135097198 isoform X1 [Scylla paramamosain]|uniref:uncharacterized protein LOC135097198 isoform X1 n=1 Tax=Scylla paramamosain TaxID=85552 RepID=UPI0030837CA9
MPKTCMTMCCREGSPKSDTTIDETPEDNLWLQLGFTVDSETGEHLLSPEKNISRGDVTLDSVSPLNSPSFTLNGMVPDFNLDFNLDEALKFVGLNCSETGETVWKPSEPEPTSDNKESPGKEEEDSLDTLNDTLDDMIQASQLHPQHLRSLQKTPRVCILLSVTSPCLLPQGTAQAASHSTNQNILQEKSFLRTQLIIYVDSENDHSERAEHFRIWAMVLHMHHYPLHAPAAAAAADS